MNFDNNFPKDTEWILNKFIDKDKPVYEFDIWKHGKADKSIARFKDKTALGLIKKIKKLTIKLNKNGKRNKSIKCEI